MPFESRPDNDAVNKLLCHDGPKYLCKVCGASFVRSNHGKSHIRLKQQVAVLSEIQASDNAAAHAAEEAQSGMKTQALQRHLVHLFCDGFGNLLCVLTDDMDMTDVMFSLVLLNFRCQSVFPINPM